MWSRIDQLDAGLSEPSPQIAAFIELGSTPQCRGYVRLRLHMPLRRADPQPDLMSAIANATVDGEHPPVPILDGVR